MKPRAEAYDDTMRQEALRRLAEGESTREVARALDVAQTTVCRWARAARARRDEWSRGTAHVDQGR
jgi:transposase